jgi:hypothetical protein
MLQREIMIKYLEVKLSNEDWHGVQDAGSDLRDIDSEIKALSFVCSLVRESQETPAQAEVE